MHSYLLVQRLTSRMSLLSLDGASFLPVSILNRMKVLFESSSVGIFLSHEEFWYTKAPYL